MKKYTLGISSLMLVLFASSVFGQVFGVGCPTLEQQQAAYNQSLANKVVVINASTQQLQCYYQQLATYWQQRDKTNQQIAKDIQQREKDLQQIASDKVLAIREAELMNPTTGYDELDLFIQAVLPLLGDHCANVSTELKRIHTNRSGGGDLTNPGGGGNLNGFDNPHRVH